MKSKRENWIVAVSNTDEDGVNIERVSGTLNMVKRYMHQVLISYKECDKESFDYYISVDGGSTSLYGCAVFNSYHVDVTAVVEKEHLKL